MNIRSRFLPLVVLLVASLAASAQSFSFSGQVVDQTGAVIPQAIVTVKHLNTGGESSVSTDDQGRYTFGGLRGGEYTITASAKGFALKSARIAVPGTRALEIKLAPGTFTQDITVVGTEMVSNAETASRIAGSVDVIETRDLEVAHVFNFSEALRKAAGVNVRDEEGFGLRPNIGLRGLNPTRSSKVLLLEDGVPITYAPYGDNASYYHPPVERFTGIEVVKGSGQIQYGPSTIGGVINYVTPQPPSRFGGSLILFGGNRDYFNGQLNVGGTFNGVGLMLDYMHKQGDGARDYTHSGLNDFTFKLTTPLGTRQALTFKANHYNETSNVTYSGLTQDEWNANRRQNPFKNDFFYGRRWGASVHHSYAVTNSVMLNTNAYGAFFRRHWWRQSSNSAQRPNDSQDPACGGMANLYTTCGNEGRLREYGTFGVEPRVKVSYSLFGLRNEADFGVRAHFERQDREQKNGPLPTSRDGVLVEENIRENSAYSAFVQNRFLLGKFTVTPGLRVERIFYDRTNRLNGAEGRSDLTQFVPGVGVAYAHNDRLTLFAGVHRGFAPPRTEDVISNTGGVVELDPELSWNYEVGARTNLHRGVRMDFTAFRMDYENQIVPASLAGGLGAALTNGGATLQQGLELSGRIDTDALTDLKHNFYLRPTYTWIPAAEFVGSRFSNISGFSTVSVTGNRLPYAPEHALTLGLGYSHPFGLDVLIEPVYLSGQFTDDLNTVGGTANGQRGLIAGNTTWNGAVNYRVEPWHSTLFVTVKNIANQTFLVDRSRGMLPNSPRLVQGGIRVNF